MKKKIFLLSILSLLLVGCGGQNSNSNINSVENTSNEQLNNPTQGAVEDNDANALENKSNIEADNATLPTKEEVLTKVKDNSDAENSAKVLDISFDDNKVVTTVEIYQQSNAELTQALASHAVASITDVLLEYEKWETYIVNIQNVGEIILYDEDKTTSDYGPYFDEFSTGYENRLRELYGLNAL